MPAQGDAWAVDLIRRISDGCGRRLPGLWKVRLNRGETPALVGWLASGEARQGDVLHDPENREDRLAIGVLRRDSEGDEEYLMAPTDDLVLAPDDEMLLIGGTAARRALDLTMLTDSAREYVQTGRRVPTGWFWRRLAGIGAQVDPARERR